MGPRVPAIVEVLATIAVPAATPTMPNPNPKMTWETPQIAPPTNPGMNALKGLTRKTDMRFGTAIKAATQGSTPVDNTVKIIQVFSHSHFLV
jgi:hypothetical protein